MDTYNYIYIYIYIFLTHMHIYIYIYIVIDLFTHVCLQTLHFIGAQLTCFHIKAGRFSSLAAVKWLKKAKLLYNWPLW